MSPILFVWISVAGEGAVDPASPDGCGKNSLSLVAGPGSRLFATSERLDCTSSKGGLDRLLDLFLLIC